MCSLTTKNFICKVEEFSAINLTDFDYFEIEYITQDVVAMMDRCVEG